ncbi:hypothetical protein LTR85_006521 [Meristemomyces frigidus]|nr:hypothetical protein LTR85_006521 [Meristemomyces frigidus]
MKRWQDRGEVQDSDDEDVGLSNESQSPEQARKRPRLDDSPLHTGEPSSDGHDEHDNANENDEEADEPWLQPLVATTYSRKVRAVEISVPKATPPSPKRLYGDLHVHGPSSPPQAAQKERDLEGSSPTAPELAEDDPFAGPGSSLSTDSDELPSASQLLAGTSTRRQEETVTEQPYDRSATSSPLTEREVSPPPGFRLPGALAPAVTPIAISRSSGEDDGSATDRALAADLLQAESLAAAGGRRQLRVRKEIQLHPYLYDKTLYRQQWRQRGLKPVHYTVRNEATETQDQSYSGDESQSQKRLGNHSSSPTRPSSASGPLPDRDSTGLRALSQTPDSDEEFPDIDTLLNRRPSGGVQDGRKRRKISHLPGARGTEVTTTPHTGLLGTDSHFDEFSVPPSPPPTSSDSAQQPGPKTLPSGFRLPAGMTPAALPTPQVSSNIRPSRTVDWDGGSDSESLPRRSRPSTISRPPPRLLLVESSSGSEAESESEPEVEQRRLQRETKRIRGVLPASWLKIDIRAQQRKASPSPERPRRLSTASPPSARPQKGVAQRVPRGSAAPGMVGQITMSDDGDDSNDDAYAVASRPQQPPHHVGYQLAVSRNDIAVGDAMEVDWIDPMLAGASTGVEQRGTGKKRQPRIKDAFARLRSERNDFSEKRAGTKAPVNATAAVLHAWRKGSIAPKASWPAREALTETSGNRQVQLPAPVRRDVEPKRSIPDRLIAVRRPRPRQTQLQPIVIDQRSQQTDDEMETVRSPRHDAPGPTFRQPSRRFHVQPQANRVRGAQVETSENAFDQEHRTSAFERRINCLTESVAARARKPTSQALPLQRFLEFGPRSAKAPAPTGLREPERSAQAHFQPRPQTLARSALPHRPRKRAPQRVDVDRRQYRQPSEPLPDFAAVEPPVAIAQGASGPILHGLGAFGTRYAIDFDIQPLALGTYFHQSTFIGSGDLAASLKLTDRDLSVLTGRMRVHVGDEILEWGAWTEEVAAGLARIPATISEALLTLSDQSAGSQLDDQLAIVTANVDHMLRSIVRYCSRCLTFLDPIDRKSCVQHLQRFIENLLEAIAERQIADSARRKLDRRCLLYALVVAAQAYQLSRHSLVPAHIKPRGDDLVSAAARKLARHIIRPSLDELRAFYEDNRHSSKRESGIKDDDGTIASIIILHHCLRTADLSQASFWAVVIDAMDVDVSKLSSVSALDRLWYDLFSFLPALEVDESGIARPGSRLRETQQDWALLKRLLDRLFAIYPAASALRGSTSNDYVRATLTRCYRLFTRWGWWKCETVLGTVYDFFAQRSLAPLHNEESRGSPKFLEDLPGEPSLEAQPEDRSFHLFLKMLAIGLQGMRKHGRYSDKKIGGIAWRFIPNHGRMYRKDADVRQMDLDALRNHHDLLCTLHYASPPGHQPRLDLLGNLVDHSTSHREACRLSVRSWSNLASFQASTNEPVEALHPFIEWFGDILQTTITQYRLAKTEAEHDYAIAKAQGAIGLTESVMTATINSNQRQIAATLVDTLAGLKRALQSARALPGAVALVEGSRFCTVLSSFDASERRLHPTLQEALSVATAALAVARKLEPDDESQQRSEESQDYGDSSALHEFAATQHPSTGSKATIADVLSEPIGQLISNVFGADQTIDDTMLTKIVDLWVQLAKESVRTGKRSWASYLDDYSSHSWRQLRDTEQRRKFTPYFLACVVNRAYEDVEHVKRSVLSSWLVSLVDRGAMLKYQHELTAAVLNHIDDEPLLHNPPFSRDNRTGMFNIGLHELRQRRLALISGVLSNMRKDFDEALYNHPHRLTELRRTYTDMLRSVMQAMKDNYLELQTSMSTSMADPNVHGAYVDFVQHVVSYLQEHTADVYRVDAFFTDSSAFPLPATDPMYVVGRLKGYVPKLAESRTRKQLATFIHAVSERAAVDGQQQYLVDQLCSAMEGVLERGSSAAPSLRHVVLTAIFPAYFENALSTACSWILALPLLRACKRIFAGLLYDVKMEDDQSVNGIINTVEAVLTGMHKPLELALLHPGLLRLPHVQSVLGEIFDSSRAILTLCNHLRRSSERGEAVANSIHGIYVRGREITAYLTGSQADTFDPVAHTEEQRAVLWKDTKAFAQQQVQDAFKNDWHAHDGQYFVKRGNSSKEVVVALRDEEDEQQHLLACIEGFGTSFEAIIDGRARIRTAALRHGCGMGGVMV